MLCMKRRMGFFVPESLLQSKNQSNSNSQTEKKLDLLILMNLKQLGFSIEGINALKLADSIEIMNYYTGHSEDDGGGIRAATQADIDKLLS